MLMRRKTRQIHVGQVAVGGDAPVSVQSMTTFSPVDTEQAAAQIERLQQAGADIVRIAVPDRNAAESLRNLKQKIHLPLVADIHFDYRLALTALECGIDALRINPGNIGSADKVMAVVNRAKPLGVPIRIGINAGSLPEKILEEHGGHPTAEGMVECALEHIRILESQHFYDMVISLKSTDVPLMVKANRILAEKVEYPLHLGVTEAGTAFRGTVKSSVGIGALLLDGIGDTIRVSLTDDPVKEITAGKEILTAAGIRNYGPVMISCPTCGRCQVNLIDLAQRVEARLQTVKKPIRVAVMGCVVNGPGEAREADFGIAGGKGCGLVFRKGKIIRTVPEKQLISALMEEINRMEEK